jgi:hypothetical protein
MNKEQELLDEVFKNYLKDLMRDNISKDDPNYILLSKEQFINRIKTDSEFAEKWGLQIGERELSDEMRYNIWFNNNYETGMEKYFDPNKLPDFDNEYYEPTPTKLIAITYNDKTIESYE